MLPNRSSVRLHHPAMLRPSTYVAKVLTLKIRLVCIFRINGLEVFL